MAGRLGGRARAPDGEEQALFSTDGSDLLQFLVNVAGQFGLGDFSVDTAGRLYVVDAAGGIRPGFPVRVPMLAPGLLPTVATGTPGSPALASLNGGGTLTTAIHAAAGPVMLFDPDGAPALGLGSDAAPRPLAMDFPAGFPDLPVPANDPASFSFDAPFFGALGSVAFGDVTGDGVPEIAAPTAGLRTLLDVAAPGSQEFGDHQVAVWNPTDGSLLPAFPRVMDDMQFLTEPALADVDGDGRADVVQGSGVYLVRAYTAEGAVPTGWPKFTHGWIVGTPAAGDVDGDGLIEVIAATREGRLFAWDTPAPATAEALPWPFFGRDRRHTRNLAADVSVLAPERRPFEAFAWWFESLWIEFFERLHRPR
jgi:hypothetical protein